MADRMKLTVTEVKEPRPVGQAEVLDFMATGPDNKTLKYGVWSKTLYEHIKVGAVLDAEVETKVSDKTDGQGEHYVNRKVVQLYVAGQPVVHSQGKSGGNWQSKPDNTASIEAQTAAKIGGELLAAKIINEDHPLGKLTIDWCKKRLTVLTNDSPPVSTAPESPKPAAKPAPAKAGDKITTEQLLNRVKTAKGFGSAETAQFYLQHEEGFTADQIAKEPEAVWAKISPKLVKK